MKRAVFFSVVFLLHLLPQSAAAVEPLLPIAEPLGLDAKKVKLGKMLFHEPKLSKNGTVSCASCHDLDTGGMDGLQHSFGIDGEEGDVNAPTVFNSALNFRQFFDGRAKTLEDQVSGPIENPKEMGNKMLNVTKTLRANKTYNQLFKDTYDDGLTSANVRHAIAEFERSLTLTNSRFDLYLRGDKDAISDEEKQGYKLFKEYGCVACHQGAGVGGNMFQKFGVMASEGYFKDRGTPITTSDLGRYNQTKNDYDKYVYKVPSLRMVTLTAPYFHDGSVETLKEAIQKMAEYQLGRNLPEKDATLIEAFLHTLVGPYDRD